MALWRPEDIKPANPQKAVITTGTQNGSTAGECLTCKAIGWICEYPYGLPHGHKKGDEFLTHLPICPVGELLDEDGYLIQG